MISRRTLLQSASAVTILATLGACTFLQKASTVDPQKVADNLSVVAKAITTVEDTIRKLTLIPFDVRTKVVAWIDDFRAQANSFTSSMSTDAIKTLVQKVSDDFDSAYNLIKPFLSPTSTGIFSDAALVISVIKTLVGIAGVVALAPPPEAEYEAALARLRLIAARR